MNFNKPDRVNCEKSFSRKNCGALKYSLNSSAVGGGESMSKVYGECIEETGLREDAGVPRSRDLNK